MGSIHRDGLIEVLPVACTDAQLIMITIRYDPLSRINALITL